MYFQITLMIQKTPIFHSKVSLCLSSVHLHCLVSRCFLVLFVLVFAQLSHAQIDSSYLNKLYHEHDVISLPNWGPYTKNYAGITHISSQEEGISFDLSVFPGFYRGKISPPNVNFETGYHPWETSPKLDYYSYRHELEWKDEIYTDISYSKIDDQARLITIEAVNNTEYAQSISLHLMGSIHFPSIRPYSANFPIYPIEVALPEKGTWTDGIAYSQSDFAVKTPFINLTKWGLMEGEVRKDSCSNGSCLEVGTALDRLVYHLSLEEEFTDAALIFRYQFKEKGANGIKLELAGSEKELELEGDATSFQTKEVSLGRLLKGNHSLTIEMLGGTSFYLDGFAIVEKKQKDQIRFVQKNWEYTPEIIEGPTPNTILLKYKDVDTYYGLKWEYEDFEVREWYYESLSDGFRRLANSNVGAIKKNWWVDEKRWKHFTNIYLRPLTLKSKSTQVTHAYVYSGTEEEVYERLKLETIDKEKIYNEVRKSLLTLDDQTVPAGKAYLLSNRIFAANILGNIVFPVYTQGQYIKHYPPGRFWDVLYTWDAGFIGLGLAQLDAQNALEYLNTYLNDEDEQAAFIHHGSMVPVQHYLFKELWEKTQSEEYLAFFYPKLKKYYDFYVGKSGSSTMANLNSGLLQTWDYFYNSGGWDDYPPQEHVNEDKIANTTATVINTAQSIRIAKIMSQAARHLGLEEDAKEYENDIKKLSKALQKNAWDEETGYFGYVLHNEEKDAIGILKYKDSINYNMGMGGAYPLVADICTPLQEKALLEKLITKGRLWSDIGLSAVDQQAPYYSREGYWNGSVWMPHQWFFWKAMLDLGEDDFAFKIAKTALDLWKKETERTYNTYEHFIIESESGAGFHQFTGLSTPIMCWFTAYYRVGNLTTGYNVWTSSKTWNEDHSELAAELVLDYNKGEKFSLVAVMNPNYDYKVLWNGKEVEAQELHEGAFSITLSAQNRNEKGILKITKK